MHGDYVHGYEERESVRLEDQANCLRGEFKVYIGRLTQRVFFVLHFL
jgi:hypothetical protein